MNCPLDKTTQLNPITLVDGLPAMQCPNCGGVWVDSNAYLTWRKTQTVDQPRTTQTVEVNPTWDVDELKLCPSSGHIMGRYRVLAGSNFHLDRCGHCNGIWFDKHEWDALVELGLHDNVNDFFTRSWQEGIHVAEAQAAMEKLYTEKFGAEDYARIKEVRAWLRAHPRQGMLLAFLQASDPYKV